MLAERMGIMAIDFDGLKDAPRLLMEARLKPVQGCRFQPTGFPDLGAARYTSPDGTDMLLVESAQSVANRMEIACWDDEKYDLISDLEGIPYIKVNCDGKALTNSVLEAHRINSEYIMKTAFKDTFSKEIDLQKDKPVNWSIFRKSLVRYDFLSLLHGAFLEEIDGRLRVTRALSGFIEASGISIVESGGVKNNYVQPTLKQGEGNVPFARTEFTADAIKAYFNLDLALLRGYGLGKNATRLLVALGLFKIRRFLFTGLRLRTACDLEVMGDIIVTRPDGFSIPAERVLLDECKTLIKRCAEENLFAVPPITPVEWKPEKKAKKDSSEEPSDVDA